MGRSAIDCITYLFFFIIFSQSGYSYNIKGLSVRNDLMHQDWIGVADFHDKTESANILQRKKIEELLLSCKKSDILIIAEDLNSHDRFYAQHGFYINSKNGILAGLCSFCQSNRIPIINIEYRFNRVIALSPLIYNGCQNPFSFVSTKRIPIQLILDEIMVVQLDLLKNSHPQFKKIVQKTNKMIQDEIDALHLGRFKNESMAHYLSEISAPLNRPDLIKNILTFDSILIGLKIVDETLRAPDKKKIIVFGGGTHIDQAYELLQKVAAFKPMAVDAKSLKYKSLNADTLLSKPKPIPIEILEHYLKN